MPSEVVEPTGEVGEFEEPAAVEHHGAGDERPEREGVQAGERHVAGADLQRDQEVEERGRERHDPEEDHRGAVHGEQLVVHARRDEVVVRTGQLRADGQGLDATDEEEEHREGTVHDAELLVVDGGQPVEQAAGAVGAEEAEVAALRRELHLVGDGGVVRIVGHLRKGAEGLLQGEEVFGEAVEFLGGELLLGNVEASDVEHRVVVHAVARLHVLRRLAVGVERGAR